MTNWVLFMWLMIKIIELFVGLKEHNKEMLLLVEMMEENKQISSMILGDCHLIDMVTSMLLIVVTIEYNDLILSCHKIN